MKNQKLFINSILGVLFIAFTANCNLLSSNSGNQAVSVQMQVQPTALNKAKSFNSISVDSLTEVKFIVEELELDSSVDEIQDFEVEDYVVYLPLDGSQIPLTEKRIPNGLYEEFELEISNDDDGNEVDDPDFQDGNGKYSLVVKGIYQGEEFTFKSSQDFELEFEINPALEITDETSNEELDIRIDLSSWFVDAQGNVLDPRDPANFSLINQNIENSFEAYNDDDDDDDDDNDD